MYVNKTLRLLYTSTILIYYIHPNNPNIIPLGRGVLDTTLCDKVGQWFPPPIKLTVTEILLKVVLNTVTPICLCTLTDKTRNIVESGVKHHN